MGEAVEILTGAARPILDRWFESEELKATLATDAIIGAFASPSMPGTAYVLFHHVMGETNGARGVWSYVKGGMGGLTQALAKAAADLGVEIRTDAEVARIVVENGSAAGVVLAGGDELRARHVASSVDCRLTFETFLAPDELPAEFLAEIKRIDYGSASARSTSRCRHCPTSPRTRAASPARSTAAPFTSARTRTTSSAAMTTRSTAGHRRTRSSSARSRRRSIPRSRRRGST